MAKYLSCAETAKILRKALKEAFPDVEFSVRSSTYSMGASIGVSWTDGPCADLVDLIANKFAGSSFDSMTDHRGSKMHLFGGVEVSLGADSVRTYREHSIAAINKAIAGVMRTYAVEFAIAGLAVPLAEEFKRGRLIHVQLPGVWRDLQHEIGTVLSKQSDRMTGRPSATAGNMFHISSDGKAETFLLETV